VHGKAHVTVATPLGTAFESPVLVDLAVGAGARAAAHPGDCDGVDGAVQRPVAAAVEPVPDGLPLLAGIGLVRPKAA
jgi:hypothetical protein